MKLVKLFIISLITSFAFANSTNISCQGEGYSFSVHENKAVIKTLESTYDVSVKQSGANYTGVLKAEGYLGFRFILKGKEGELKLVGPKSVTKKMKCSIIK
ncbi:hypothetical protein ABMA70_08390 [Halobacteriovorax sp. XZX-3]|uniref:hypothetical protein n=1 Tax=unclassified Halobacteriovorax TaxID=2639665 RepID=UPI000CD1F12F|nr:hypothetical protein [Halobacteriovorax sp. DA5]POB12422.1 hypothetical protein C0Z22_15505 [Halobacteriovorax sp. DA5]